MFEPNQWSKPFLMCPGAGLLQNSLPDAAILDSAWCLVNGLPGQVEFRYGTCPVCRRTRTRPECAKNSKPVRLSALVFNITPSNVS